MKNINNFRTDLALEIKELIEDEKVEGVNVKVEEDVENEILITTVKVENEKGKKSMGKEIGDYITLESIHMDSANKNIHDKIIDYGSKKIKDLIKKENAKNFLIVGLGNEFVTADSLGPKVISKLLVTRHIKDSIDNELRNKICDLSAISPGVMGQTGIETVEVIKGIVDRVKPDLIIVVDALAARNTERINSTIQISNTGIAPGSGVGNKRKEITKKTLNIPVLAIGIPTVVDAATLVNDSLNMLIEEMLKFENDENIFYDMLKNLSEQEKYNLIKQALSDTLTNMFVTPKQIDQTIERLSNIVGNMINIALHDGLSVDDINYFMN